MALTGEYALSPEGWVREQTEKILETGTTEGVQVFDRPIVLVTIRGVKSGKLRYTPLMRVEHDGRYALVASKGGAPEHPTWYHNLVAPPARGAGGGDGKEGVRRPPGRGRRAGAVVGALGGGLPAV